MWIRGEMEGKKYVFLRNRLRTKVGSRMRLWRKEMSGDPLGQRLRYYPALWSQAEMVLLDVFLRERQRQIGRADSRHNETLPCVVVAD